MFCQRHQGLRRPFFNLAELFNFAARTPLDVQLDRIVRYRPRSLPSVDCGRSSEYFVLARTVHGCNLRDRRLLPRDSWCARAGKVSRLRRAARRLSRLPSEVSWTPFGASLSSLIAGVLLLRLPARIGQQIIATPTVCVAVASCMMTCVQNYKRQTSERSPPSPVLSPDCSTCVISNERTSRILYELAGTAIASTWRSASFGPLLRRNFRLDISSSSFCVRRLNLVPLGGQNDYSYANPVLKSIVLSHPDCAPLTCFHGSPFRIFSA